MWVCLKIERPFLAVSSEGPFGSGLALSLECRIEGDITNVIALKLEPLDWGEPRLIHSKELSENPSTLCYSGWDEGLAFAEAPINKWSDRRGIESCRLALIDVREPARSPSWSELTIL